jgi:hypothetical protein
MPIGGKGLNVKTVVENCWAGRGLCPVSSVPIALGEFIDRRTTSRSLVGLVEGGCR